MSEQINDDIWYPKWPPNTQPRFTYGRPTFETHVGNSGHTWLVPAITVLPNRGDHVYVTAHADCMMPGRGFGGRTLHMPLISGTDFALRGGWHTRAEDLYSDTDIDVRHLRLTYGAVGLHRTYTGLELVGLLYADQAPQLGTTTRIVELAKWLANDRNETVYYSYLSAGGGASAQISPEGR